MSEIHNTKGEFHETEGYVHYKIGLQRYGTHFQRLGKAVVDYGLEVTSVHELKHSHGCTFWVILKVSYEDIDNLLEDLATFSKNGSICPIYDSPEDEIKDNPTDRYLTYQKEVP